MPERELDRLKEQIKYETEVLKATLLVAVATGGSAISLLLGEWTLFRVGLSGIGLFITLVAIVGVWKQDRTIRALLVQITEML